MIRKITLAAALSVTAVSMTATTMVLAQTPSRLMAGAAKAEFTPTAKDLLAKTDSIRDPLFARAIVVGSGASCAVLVGLDYGGARNELVEAALPRITAATGCPAQNILISATHTHSSNTGGLGGNSAPTQQKVADAIVVAVTAAKAKMEPVSLGYGTTQLSLNTNRDLYTRSGEWRQLPNPDGASDKTLAVVSFIGDDHVPVGVFMTYAMHPINFYLSGVISADFPGMASRTIEDTFDGDTVAIFAQGASGDQNPLYSERAQLARVRTAQGPWRETIGGPPAPALQAVNPVTEMSARMRDPVPAKDMAVYRRLVARSGVTVDAMGSLIAQGALNTMRSQPRGVPSASIAGAQRALSCPGRERLDAANPARENVNPGYKDGPTVNMKVGVLRIGDVHFVSVNGEVYSQIASRLKARSPAAKTMMVTLANGAANSGYIAPDDAYSHLTFQVIGSRLKAGCAEDGIINNALEMIGEVGR